MAAVNHSILALSRPGAVASEIKTEALDDDWGRLQDDENQCVDVSRRVHGATTKSALCLKLLDSNIACHQHSCWTTKQTQSKWQVDGCSYGLPNPCREADPNLIPHISSSNSSNVRVLPCLCAPVTLIASFSRISSRQIVQERGESDSKKTFQTAPLYFISALDPWWTLSVNCFNVSTFLSYAISSNSNWVNLMKTVKNTFHHKWKGEKNKKNIFCTE